MGQQQRGKSRAEVCGSSPEMAYRLECWCSRSRRVLWLLPRKLAGSVREICLREREEMGNVTAGQEILLLSAHSAQQLQTG